jgi:hypothetical protein
LWWTQRHLCLYQPKPTGCDQWSTLGLVIEGMYRRTEWGSSPRIRRHFPNPTCRLDERALCPDVYAAWVQYLWRRVRISMYVSFPCFMDLADKTGFCGNQLDNGASANGVNSNQCNYPCPGNQFTSCGGSYRLSLTSAVP